MTSAVLHVGAALLIATALSGIMLALRRVITCPVARYRLGMLTLALLLVLPVAQVGLATLQAAPTSRTHVVPMAQLFGVPQSAPARTVPASGGDAVRSGPVSEQPIEIDLLAIVLAVYAIGGALVVGATFVQLVRTRRILSRAVPIRDEALLGVWRETLREVGIRRRVRLLVSDDVATPASWALGAWTVIMPMRRRVMDSGQVRCVFVHELTHLGRRDHWGLLARRLIVGLYWMSPTTWLLCRAVTLDCELSCDRHVVRRTGAAHTYAHALLAAAVGDSDQLSLATSMSGAGHDELTRRITMLSMPSARPSARSQTLAAAAIVLAGVAGAAASAGALPLGTQPPQVIVMQAPTVGDGQLLPGETTAERHMRGQSVMQETVLSTAGVRMRDGRIVAEVVDMNLPENSGLGARLVGSQVSFAPGDEGATITIIGGAIEIVDVNGETRIRASVSTGETMRATCRVIADEYNFLLDAVDEHGRPTPVTIQLALGDHENPGDHHQGWVLLTDDERFRVKMRRHTDSRMLPGGIITFDQAGQGMGPGVPGRSRGGVVGQAGLAGDANAAGVGGRRGAGDGVTSRRGGGGGGGGASAPRRGTGGGNEGVPRRGTEGGNEAVPRRGGGGGASVPRRGTGGGNEGVPRRGTEGGNEAVPRRGVGGTSGGPGDGLPGGGAAGPGDPGVVDGPSGVPILSSLPLIGLMFSVDQ